MAAAADIHQYLKELADKSSKPSKFWHQDHDEDGIGSGSLQDLVLYAAYVQTLAECVEEEPRSKC